MTVDEQQGPGHGRWPRLRVVVIVAVVALAGLLYVVVNHRSEATSGEGAAATPSASISTPPSTTASGAPPGPACLPRITETGFSTRGNNVEYGVIARSDCPDAMFNLVTSVRVLDTAGRPIAGQEEVLPEINVLLPGQQVGGAGRFYMRTVRPVGRVEVRFTDGDPAPVGLFAAWPTLVRVTDLKYEKHRGSSDYTTVTGQIVTAPARAGLCTPHASLILRAANGKIIGGVQGEVHGDVLVTFDLVVPAKADLRKTTANIALGEFTLRLDLLRGRIDPAGAACG